MDYTITPKEFENFRALIYQECGISLNDSKKTLLVSRLSKRLRMLELDSFQAYYDRVAGETDGEEFTLLLDLVSTNKTDFFREPKHFDFLREQILPTLQSTRRVRIWSSASSSGEEPYTIAMTLHDSVPDPERWDCKILASDISTRVLAKAASGIYEADRVRDLPPDLVERHFLKGKGERAGMIKVKPHLIEMVRYRRINLMDDTFPIKGHLDLIFCRNVMIYFDRPTQTQLVNKFHRYLKPGGFLFIGHSENIQSLDQPFKAVAPTIYRKEM
ncbi:MAG: protein-glutamate O-methyltransferase CheR [Nitrospirota bacterium]|nr:protein-glutamate O-methyltransferase CheR [Nitrospirota bacterium]